MGIHFGPAYDFDAMVAAQGWSVVSHHGGRRDGFATFTAAEAHEVAIVEGTAVLPGDTKPEETRLYRGFSATSTAILNLVAADPRGEGFRVGQDDAELLLDALQITDGVVDGQVVGSATVTDLRARLALADIVTVTDPGHPTIETLGDGGMHMVEMGREPGYLQRILTALEALCAFCDDHAIAEICWA
ncbi:hypothetical protein [Nocardia altamirensis]|uniref:hypothetical protein n=1 Tax=Nocardia altamirensis TaxID=472158 RepID=UPI0008405D1E|nr:hypothetical protein [Nocardia altamirensis]